MILDAFEEGRGGYIILESFEEGSEGYSIDATDMAVRYSVSGGQSGAVSISVELGHGLAVPMSEHSHVGIES